MKKVMLLSFSLLAMVSVFATNSVEVVEQEREVVVCTGIIGGVTVTAATCAEVRAMIKCHMK